MENYRELKEREKILGTVLAKMGPTETEVQHHKYSQTHTVHMFISLQVKEDIDMTTEEAIRLIQVRRFGSEIIELWASIEVCNKCTISIDKSHRLIIIRL